ncbi:DUF1176 domain-containing protein [Duganella sp. FT80W]|uniref:DUF1176 domain-containing protein n=1 Tax=Duganella guangzhouensis TaxID=2666084 RepID=A0A6I2L9Z8_9BURK|nr:DUF1176 domain-containing protein [Duganella guangzhouensis]MRW94542.1 DUF1176 domain-containing protein [Duganella guangzhouensis]
MKTAALLFGALLAAGAQAQTLSFKDWSVACDNTRHCEAVGYQREELELPVTLWLARDAGGNAPLRAMLDTMSEDDSGGPLSIRVGKLLIKDIKHREFTPEQVARLLPAMKEADSAQVSDGKHQWELSLAGLKAALLKMDDVQGRVGTVTALIRPGGKPASAVPTALPAPVLRAAVLPPPRAGDDKLLPELLKAVRDEDCSTDAPSQAEGRNSQLARLSNSELLLIAECTRGAYQASYGLWRVADRKPYKPVRLLLPNAEGKTDDMLVEPYFEKGVLQYYAKGRGINDCGSAGEWLWTADGFKLLSVSEGPQCRGFPGGGFMLRLWTAQQTK